MSGLAPQLLDRLKHWWRALTGSKDPSASVPASRWTPRPDPQPWVVPARPAPAARSPGDAPPARRASRAERRPASPAQDQQAVIERIRNLQQQRPKCLSVGWMDIDALPAEVQTLSATVEELLLISCRRLSDLSALALLPRLKRLDLSFTEQLKDLRGLNGLAELQTLDLRQCAALESLVDLDDLPALQSLTLVGCPRLNSLRGIERLRSLVQLDLSACPALTDLSALADLQRLEVLNINRCTGLHAFRGNLDRVPASRANWRALQSLRSVQVLRIFESAPLQVGPDINTEDCWPQLRALFCDHLENAPAELGSTDENDNCLGRVQAWRDDLRQGSELNSQLKVLILGNGRVGKTQLCRRLRGESFDRSVPSTHGIQLARVALPLGPAVTSATTPAAAPVTSPAERGGVELTLWDFGGQDIYTGTHALFLDARAVYVLCWTPQHEAGEEQVEKQAEGGIAHLNRPRGYWLDYIFSLAGAQAPVLLAQTQCDEDGDAVAEAVPAGTGGFGWLQSTACSAAQPIGMQGVLRHLASAAALQLERYGRVALPSSWLAVAAELRHRCENLREKTMTLDDFQALCRKRHGIKEPDAVLGYLHRSGQVFWRAGIFGNRVVLAQQWALEGVYAVLDRDLVLPIIRQQHGRFTAELLGSTVWKDRTNNERDLFLSMMQQCQICFPISKDVYIAPAMLPPEKAMAAEAAEVWRGASAVLGARLDYPFLHEGVLRAVLCEVGQRAGVAAVYWAYGFCLYDHELNSVLRMRSQLPGGEPGAPGGGWITVECSGEHPQQLARIFVELIQQHSVGAAPQVAWTLPGEPSAPRPPHQPRTPRPPRKPGMQALRAPDRAETLADLRFAVRPRAPGTQPGVYVSYAWGGKSEQLAQELETRLQTRGIRVVRDRHELRPGDWISRFMAELGRAEKVVVIISDKYLRSAYCMRELLYLYQTSSSDVELMQQRVVPVLLEDVAIHSARQRAAYIVHWSDEVKALEAAYADVHLLSLSEADRREWLAILDFKHRVSEMMAWAADRLMPRGQAGVETAVQMIAGQMAAAGPQQDSPSLH